MKLDGVDTSRVVGKAGVAAFTVGDLTGGEVGLCGLPGNGAVGSSSSSACRKFRRGFLDIGSLSNSAYSSCSGESGDLRDFLACTAGSGIATGE